MTLQECYAQVDTAAELGLPIELMPEFYRLLETYMEKNFDNWPMGLTIWMDRRGDLGYLYISESIASWMRIEYGLIDDEKQELVNWRNAIERADQV
jgi:hypothetical protein